MFKTLIKTSIFVFLQWIAGVSYSSAQTYVGLGFTEFSYTYSGLDAGEGVVLTFQRQIRLGESRWSLSPALNAGYITSRVKTDIEQYFTTLDFTPSIDFDVLKAKHFHITPYLGPFISWVLGERNLIPGSNNSFPVTEGVNEIRYGAEVGFSVTYLMNENISFKLMPYRIKIGNDEFKQGMISLLIKI